MIFTLPRAQQPGQFGLVIYAGGRLDEGQDDEHRQLRDSQLDHGGGQLDERLRVQMF